MISTCLQKLSHCPAAVWFDRLKKLQSVVGVSVDDVNTNCRIDVMRQRVFTNMAAANSENIWRIEQLKHRLGLASVNHVKHFVISLLLPHLLKRIGQLDVRYLFRILKE